MPDPAPKFEDKKLQCKDCEQWWVLTAKEQEYFSTKMTREGVPMVPPKRCSPCREAKRQAERSQGN